MTDANTTDVAEVGRQDPEDALPIDEAAGIARRIVENVEEVIVGQHEQIEGIVTAVLARGHVLIEDVPGVGKTMLARSIARSVDCEFTRIQFTPDLLPADVTGVNVFNQGTREFEFTPGPIFGNFVLGDEINRAPPKTQSALLEAMEEEQVTVDGETHAVPEPFIVVATQNTVEPNRTYELPMAQLDRFMKKLSLGYPGKDDEISLLGQVTGDHPIGELDPVASTADLIAAQETVKTVRVSEPIRDYATRLARHTREHAQLGVSPRGTIALLEAAQARALLEDREYVVPDDVQTEAPAVLSHRVQVESTTGSESGTKVVEDALGTVTVE